MRKRLKKLGVAILSTAIMVSSVPAGPVVIKAENKTDSENETGLADEVDLDEEIGVEAESKSTDETNSADEMNQEEKNDLEDETNRDEKSEAEEENDPDGKREPEEGLDSDEKTELEEEVAPDGKREPKEENDPDGKSEPEEEIDLGKKSDLGDKMDWNDEPNSNDETDWSRPIDLVEETKSVDATKADETSDSAQATDLDAGQNKVAGGVETVVTEGKNNPLYFWASDCIKQSDGGIWFSLRKREMEAGSYMIRITATGNSRGYQILLNGRAAALVSSEPANEPNAENEDETEIIVESICEDPMVLNGRETVVIRPSDGYWNDGESLSGDIVSVELLPVDEEILELDDIDEITLTGEDWFPGQFEEKPNLKRGQWVDFLILEKDGFQADDYFLTAQLSGSRNEYRIKINGEDAGALVTNEEPEDGTVFAFCEKPLTLEPGDILTVSARSGEDGFVDKLCFIRDGFEPEEFSLMTREQDGTFVYEAEDYYTRQEGVQTDGDVTFCDMQPGESLTIPVGDSLEKGKYRLTVRSNGNRTEFKILVNGEEAGSITRTGSGWDAVDLSDDSMEELLILEGGDEITISAPADYGKVDAIFLTLVEKIEDSVEEWDCIYEAEDYYTRQEGVQTDGDVTFCDMQPGESLTIPVGDSLEKGKYRLTVRSNGNRTEFKILVNGEETGSITRTGSGWDAVDLSDDSMEELLILEGGDEITISAPADYGKVDAIFLTLVEKIEDSAEEWDGIYEAEDYYTRQEGVQTDGDVTFCDMQPGESLTIPVGDLLESGNYQLTVRSNGSRTKYEIYVNNKYVRDIVRAGTGWNAADLTDDSLDRLLTLNPGDEIRIYAPEEYGKVDLIILTAVEGQPFEEQDTKSGIVVSAKPDVVPAGSVLLVEEPDEASLENICQDSGIDRAKGTFYHIRLIDGDGNTVELGNGKVMIKIPLPSGYDSNAIKVYRVFAGAKAHTALYDTRNGYTINEITDYSVSGGFVKFDTSELGIFAILNTKKVETGSYVYEAEDYYGRTEGIETDGSVTYCDMQPGEVITIPVDDQNLPEGNYRLSISSNGTRTGFSIYINGVPAGIVKRGNRGTGDNTGWSAEGLTNDEYDGVFHLKPGDSLQMKAPENKYGDEDAGLYGKLDSVTLIATEEEPKASELLEQVVFRSEDWYFGAPDNAGGVNLRPNDQIDYFIRTEDGFGEEENKYQLTVSAGGFRTQYTVKVNGKEIGTLSRPNTEWGELNDSVLGQIVTLKAGDVLSIYAQPGNWGTVADITLDKIREQEPFKAADAKSGILVKADPGVVPEGSLLAVEAPDEAELERICQSYSLDRSKGTFYRIRLKDGQGNPVQVLGNVKVFLPIPEGCEENALTVYRIGEDGNLEPVTKTAENGMVCIETKELGLIALFDDIGDVRTLQAEDFYENSAGIQTDGNVKMCDVQPGESVNFTIPADMAEGYYRLTVSSNGTRTVYTISVNGKVQGVVKRGESGWGAADLTKDRYHGVLKLKAGDILTLTASVNLNEGDNLTYGKLDSIILASAPEPAPYQELDTITLSAADWYGGTQDSSGGMNVRPGDGIDFVVRKQDGFTEGDYVIKMRTSGFRKNYTVKVNGQSVMLLPVRTSEWGKYLTATSLVTVHLTPGDVVTFYEAESWGCIDTVTFYKGAIPAGDSMADRTGGRVRTINYDESAGAKASGTEPVFIYQGEGYYRKQPDNPAADLQPGEQIEIVLADNANFVDGLYQVTVASCGVRDHLFVKVNGRKTGRIDRKPGGYGMDKMSRDRLGGTVTLYKSDLLCIEAAPEGWGWVDYIRLDLLQRLEGEGQGRRYEYRAVDYYSKKQADWDVADLQPGEKIEIPVNDESFEEGYYYVSVTSCGGRKKMSVEINGQPVGSIQRNSNNYGISSLTRDTMPAPVYVRRKDRVAVCAPADGGWAWVDRVDLIKAAE